MIHPSNMQQTSIAANPENEHPKSPVLNVPSNPAIWAPIFEDCHIPVVVLLVSSSARTLYIRWRGFH